MYTWYRRLGLLLCGLALVLVLTACHKREQRTMKVHEEQREGEVHEQQPGEMVVE
jgi:hypothetical protein